MTMTWKGLLSVIGLLAIAPSCNNQCADVTCLPTVYLDGKVDLSSAGDRLAVHACLDARCADVTFDRTAGECMTLDVTASSSLCLHPRSDGTTVVSLTLSSVGGDPPLADGDTVVLTIGAEAGGAPIVDVTRSVTYSEISADPGCGTTCRAAQLTF